MRFPALCAIPGSKRIKRASTAASVPSSAARSMASCPSWSKWSSRKNTTVWLAEQKKKTAAQRRRHPASMDPKAVGARRILRMPPATGAGVAGAFPTLGDKAAWEPRIKQGHGNALQARAGRLQTAIAAQRRRDRPARCADQSDGRLSRGSRQVSSAPTATQYEHAGESNGIRSAAHDHAHGHDAHAHHPSGFMRWVTTTNHKDIGTLYLWFSLTMFFVGGMLALVHPRRAVPARPAVLATRNSSTSSPPCTASSWCSARSCRRSSASRTGRSR